MKAIHVTAVGGPEVLATVGIPALDMIGVKEARNRNLRIGFE